MIIKAYSKAKYSSWIYYTPLSALFDAGEGINCLLEERLVTIRDIFLSHGHTDHYTGLINILMTKLAHYQSSGVIFPTRIYYPGADRTLQAYVDYVRRAYRLERSIPPVEFLPVAPGERHELDARRRSYVEVFAVGHTRDVAAVGYRLGEVRTRLREEYLGWEQKEIQRRIAAGGKDALTYEADKRLIVYSGDGRAIPPAEVEGADILMHEATFLRPLDRKGQLHTSLEEVVGLARGLDLQFLLLTHFSSRYTVEQIARHVQQAREKLAPLRVEFIPPGQVYQLD